MNRLYDIIHWVEREGPPMALNRIRLKMLSRTLRERIDLERCEPDTMVSQDYLVAFKAVAAEVVGKPVPSSPSPPPAP